MSPEPVACALLIIAAFSAAGVLHVLWLRWPLSSALAVPIDAGWRWRGRRVLGEHKTLRGFAAIVPATGLLFAALGATRDWLPPWLAAGLWQMETAELLLLGVWAAFWFMAGELPNSFLKRQWGLAPGDVPAAGAKRAICLLLDRVDSILAMLLALALVVPVPALTWLLVLVFGPGIHFLFSVLLWLTQVKKRFA